MTEHREHTRGRDEAQHDPFAVRLRQELDRSCDTLDGYTLSRLNAIRNAALERKHDRRRRALLLPFGGLVTACVLVLAVSLVNRTGSVGQDNAVATPLEDLEILAASEGLEFYEDYEFYQWLAENEI